MPEIVTAKVPKEKLSILQAALATPDSPSSKTIMQKATERGWLTVDKAEAPAAPALNTGRDKVLSAISQPDQPKSALPMRGSAFLGPVPDFSARKAVGVGFGALEAANPVNVPRGIEVMGRAAFTEKGGILERLGKAEEHAVIPGTREIGAAARALVPDEGEEGLGFKERFRREKIHQREAEQFLGDDAMMVGALLTLIKPGIAAGKSLFTAGKKGSQLVGKGIKKVKDVATKKNVTKVGKELSEEFGREIEGFESFLGGTKKPKTHLGKAKELTTSILSEDRPEVIQAILQRPRKIRALLKRDRFNMDDLAEAMAGDLRTIEKKLGQAVGKFRNVVAADDVPSVETRQLRRMISLARKRLFVKGKDVVTLEKKTDPFIGTSKTVEKVTKGAPVPAGKSSDLAKLDKIESLLAADKISPQDALKTVDAMGDMLADSKDLLGKQAQASIRKIRKALKTKLRGKRSKVAAKQWADADEAFMEFRMFQKEFDPLKKLESVTGRESFINTLLGSNKSSVRQQLTKFFGLAKKGKVRGVKTADQYFKRVAEMKAAQGIKARIFKKGDPIADEVARMISKWENYGTLGGGAVGAYFGEGSGFGGASSGALAFMFLGRMVGRRIGVRLSDPRRILTHAEKGGKAFKGILDKAKAAKAKLKPVDIEALNNLDRINEIDGIAGVASFLDTVQPAAAFRVLGVLAASEEGSL